jgi:hypothetical protein
MIVTNGVAIVYNRARHAKQGDLAQRGRWSGHHSFEPAGQAENFQGVAHFLEKRAPGFTGR